MGSFRPGNLRLVHVQMPDSSVTHHALELALKDAGSSWSAGQVHGLLCSRLAVSGAEGAERWFVQVLEDVAEGSEARSAVEAHLDTLCAGTWRQLVERQSEFDVLLPDDDDPASLRAEAMAQWCEGFLHGLVSEERSETLKARLSAEPLADIIRDMLQITRASAGDEDDEEAEEAAYAELVEYLRVAAQLAYEELADFRHPDEDLAPNEDDTLH